MQGCVGILHLRACNDNVDFRQKAPHKLLQVEFASSEIEPSGSARRHSSRSRKNLCPPVRGRTTVQNPPASVGEFVRAVHSPGVGAASTVVATHAPGHCSRTPFRTPRRVKPTHPTAAVRIGADMTLAGVSGSMVNHFTAAAGFTSSR